MSSVQGAPVPLWRRLTAYKTTAAAVVGAVAQALALGVLPEPWKPWAAVVIALGTALGVYRAPNDPQA